MDKKARFYFTESILYVDWTVIKLIVRAAWSSGESYKSLFVIIKLHNAKMN